MRLRRRAGPCFLVPDAACRATRWQIARALYDGERVGVRGRCARRPLDRAFKQNLSIGLPRDEGDQSFKHAGEVFVDIAVGDAEDAISVHTQILCPLGIMGLFFRGAVGLAVDFHNDPFLATGEIRKIRSDRALPGRTSTRGAAGCVAPTRADPPRRSNATATPGHDW